MTKKTAFLRTELDALQEQGLRNTISTLLRLGVVPLVNENDTVATDEIRFGDRVAHLLGSDVLVEADRRIALPGAARAVARHRDDLHSETRQPTGDLLADPAVTQDGNRPAPKTLSQSCADASLSEAVNGVRDSPRQHQHVGNRELCNGLGVAGPDARDVCNEHSGSRRRGNVDSV